MLEIPFLAAISFQVDTMNCQKNFVRKAFSEKGGNLQNL
jgi:hypothetical protein